MRHILACLCLISGFTFSCAGNDPDSCAFRARDGSCAVVASSTGALECKLDDHALCETVTSFIESGKGATPVASTSAALVNTGVGAGGSVRIRPPSLVCEPDGTFMCTCCSVGAGCYPCPTKLF